MGRYQVFVRDTTQPYFSCIFAFETERTCLKKVSVVILEEIHGLLATLTVEDLFKLCDTS